MECCDVRECNDKGRWGLCIGITPIAIVCSGHYTEARQLILPAAIEEHNLISKITMAIQNIKLRKEPT